jgi:transglutaminase-like putative cysteine protease
LEADSLVPVDGKIAAEAARVAGEASGPRQRARRVYDHIVDTVRYDKSGTGWGRGDALFACDVRAGNCTDFHSLFIGQVRSLKVPARFVMGLSIPKVSEGRGSGYHCWAEFFDPARGWVPVDASEASKNPALRDFYFGNLDPDRVAFTRGRDLRPPGARGGPLNYMIGPHVEADGRVLEDVTWSWSWKDLT